MTLSSSDIQEMSALSRRAIARLAASGKIPGAFRKDGLHFGFHQSPELDLWCRHQKRMVEARNLPKARLNPRNKSVHIVTIEGVHSNYISWERIMGREIPTWGHAKRSRLMHLLAPMAAMHAQLQKADGDHREEVQKAISRNLGGIAD